VISSDYLALREISQDSSDPEMQKQAIEALGSVDGPDTAEVLVGIYRSTAVEDVREAVLEGLMIGDQDEAMLELYRSSDNPGEKKELLEYLVMMDSDAVWDLIDAALEEQR
jgi:hypothetical protein